MDEDRERGTTDGGHLRDSSISGESESTHQDVPHRLPEPEFEANTEALRDLCEIASDPELAFDVKQQELLEVGTDYLDLPYAFVTEISDTTQTIVAAKGSHELLRAGESLPTDAAYCRKVVTTDERTFAIQNATHGDRADDPADETFEFGTYLGGRVNVNGDLYGTVCFVDSEPRETGFSELERTFVELLCGWVSYELEQRESRMELETKNQQLEEFASTISHDLRNPLSVAEGYLDIELGTSPSENLRKIKQAHDRMHALIDDVLSLSHEGDVIGELTEVDLAVVSESCWQNVETQDATLTLDSEGRIMADENRLIQLVENLMRNAVEHGGSDVTVTVGDLPDGFYIEDTGRGIPEDDREQLFESGYSTKSGGTGIGLRIVEQIATAHGWEIAVTTGTVGGARFEITDVVRP